MPEVITTAILQKARKMKEEGKTIKEIAYELGVNYHTISHHLSDIKAACRLTKEQIEQIITLDKVGYKAFEIAQKLDLNYSTVVYQLKKRKKELASAATDTSSKFSDDRESANPVLTDDYNRLLTKCQALESALKLAYKGILAQYEEMSQEQQQAFDLGQICSEIEYRMKQGGIDPDV